MVRTDSTTTQNAGIT